MRYAFERDDDGHWYIISENMIKKFYDYVEAMENGEDYEIDFSHYMIDNPSDYFFENPAGKGLATLI